MKQYEAVIETLERLGGIATLGQLYKEVFKIKDCIWKTKTPYASIRQIVQLRKEIYRVKPGLWALVSHKKQLEAIGIFADDEKANDSKTATDFTHAYYQGLLLYIGNMKKKETYIPPQDKSKKCIKTNLADISTISKMPPYSYPEIVQRSSTVDVVWFNHCTLGDNLLMPDSLFEIEHSTDIQNSLLKFNDLQDFNVRMTIVADVKRKPEFEKKMSYHAFYELRQKKRVSFLSYEELVKQYEMELEKQSFGFII